MLLSCGLSGEADVTVLEMEREMVLECGIGATGVGSVRRVVSGWCSRSKYSSSFMNCAMINVVR